ncbi:peptidylprolyl isomerase [Pseudenhygromyxa sp. WMMC2535]|uniref:peptidylprolyl isomerase n=1 Tax=Pseudenhygromyxa sp. WMMC2535 TaxID=2712867 RepID=UPI001553F256|nr:peptidylprolyl isomerase [Pseudenhygromyxa sp. WMMC2535]NVB36221.1 peptidylprolyl isomerase [Pseudenhygromyxa sp. WMMC2535]NVB43420.1 peptidylprolyl isomerase [Pseudenhygromyxa sp. WMMC2535]
MLGSERGKGGNLITWLILGVLALAFGLTFGLPSDQLSLGEAGLARVFGTNVTKEDFAYQQRALTTVMNTLPEGEMAQKWGVREEVFEAVIERLVLVHTGEELGLTVETHDAEVMTRDGYFMVLDLERSYPWAFDGKFDYKQFKNQFLSGYFLVSEQRYLETQRQEMLARQVRDLLSSAAVVPEAELWERYEEENNQLSIRYVRLPYNDYAELVDPTDAEVEGWIAEHGDELAEIYEREAARFLKLPAEVDLRLIEIAKPTAPPEGAEAELLALHADNLARARAKIEGARTSIVDSGEPFAAVARRLSEDPDTARSGGRYGWTQVAGTGSGLDRAVDKAAEGLADNEVSEIIEGEESFFLVTVAGHREGDVPEEDAKRELAEEAVRTARGRELARQAAEEALLAVKNGKDMAKLFDASDETIEDYGVSESPASRPKHQVEETGLFTHGRPIPGLGANPELSDKAWAGDLDSPLLDEVFEVAGGYLVAELVDKQTADREGFAAAREELYDNAARLRANGVVSGFTKRQCLLGKARTQLRINEKSVDKIMSYDGNPLVDEAGNRLTPPYKVCSRVGDRGGLLQLAALQSRGVGR